MTNEILFFVTLLVSFVGVVGAHRFFGKAGLFGWITFASVVANIEVVKCVEMFGLSVTLGNVLYGSTFLATDLLTEMYGGKEGRRAIRIGFFALIMFTILIQFSLAFIPSDDDFVSESMHQIFSLTPRICIASLIAFFISNTLDTYMYEWIGRHTKHLWVKNNVSTMTCQALDSVLFTLGAFWGVFPTATLWQLMITTCLIKALIAICDTPFLYWAKKQKT